ncbi:MAG: DUF5752 family protein [Syntrophaceae bacterium]
MSEAFEVKDCALIAISTGEYAQTLREMREKVLTAPPSSIYYHFWGGLLRPRFDDPEFQNDFAIWASHSLHDKTLAERLALIDPSDYPNLENLRLEVLDSLEERLDESERLSLITADHRFYFVRSQIVVFDTARRLTSPEELAHAIPSLSAGSIFYHVIDARRRLPENKDDFTIWISSFGPDYQELIEHIAEVDPYFTNLIELREEMSAVFMDFFRTKRG